MKPIKEIAQAERIDMGGVLVDQALPIANIDSVDPFLLIHHWKSDFLGGQRQKDVGVGPHPHRGFSPVSIVYKGALHHRDSLGNDSVIEAGGVQWMDAGKGVTHSERPSKEIAEQGGEFEIIQFWVNRPSNQKMEAAKYSPLEESTIPKITLSEGLTHGQIISGHFNGIPGALPEEGLLVVNFDSKESSDFEIEIPDAYESLIYLLEGTLEINGTRKIANKDIVFFQSTGNKIRVSATSDSRLLLLAGKPIKEKVVSYGPFVMNSTTEILQAISDAQTGKMGILIEEF